MTFKLYKFSFTLVIFVLVSFPNRTTTTTPPSPPNTFPAHFKFGAGTSAYQVEGAWNTSGKSPSNWDNFTHTQPDRIINRQNGDITTDTYHHTLEDVNLMQDLNLQFYRFSISWTRIIPDVFTRKINKDGIRYYLDLILNLKRRGIEPYVTIFHWDTPQQLEDVDGWQNETIIDHYAFYADTLFENFGKYVTTWFTFNEPIRTCRDGYEDGNFAPGRRIRGTGAYVCAHHLLKAHARVWHLYDEKYRRDQNGRISIVVDLEGYTPVSLGDLEGVERNRQFKYGWFAHPIYTKQGDYPEIMKRRVALISKYQGLNHSRLPEFTPEEIGYIRGTYDFMALNHYTTLMSEDIKQFPTEPSYTSDIGVRLTINDSWPGSNSTWLKVAPWGFRDTLLWIQQEYGNVELLMTECGVSSNITFMDFDRMNYYYVMV